MAESQRIPAPATPAVITPIAGSLPFLLGHAVGTQGYVCLATSTGASWTLNGSPDTNPNEFAPSPLPLGSPTWQSSFDSSVVWGNALTPPVPAGSDASCPSSGAKPCLLLQSIRSRKGPMDGRLLGTQLLVPHTTDYYFFRGS